MSLKYSLILVIAGLLVSISADVSEIKNVWSSPVNKENNYENYKSPNNAYLPPLHQPTTPPANNIYPSYQNYYNVPSVTQLPHQQYYNPGSIYSQQHNYGPIPSNKYLPTLSQNSHYNNYNQNLNPQTDQIIPKPSSFLTVPYNMGIKAIGYMSNVLHNVHQGVYGQPFQYGGKITTGYGAQQQNGPWGYGYNTQQNSPWGNGYNTQQNGPWGYGYNTQQNGPWGYGYKTQQNAPWGYGYKTQQNVPWGYKNRNWQVGPYNTPTYNHGVQYGGYNNLRKDYNNWTYPNKGNVYGYNNQNRLGYSQWNNENNAKPSW